MATAAELLAVLRADSRQFSATMTKAVAQTRGLESSASRFSGVAKAGFATVGVAVAKSVADFVRFESTMTRLVTLAGASQGEIQGLSQSVLNMARGTATAPQDLAEGLYFVYSAGIKGKAAMETLEYAAKGAAIGLGTVETVADAVTSVLNAYGTANISAARATAVLREAVEQSKREADEIAGAIGRVLPIASEMGVEFEQVAGAIAAMTRTGLDANEAVTALRGVLLGILDPTDRAEEVLRQFGFSVGTLQEAIRSGNVVDVLLQLKAAFGENRRAMAQVFPNVRALVGVLALVGEKADSARAAFEGVAKATVEDLNRSFEVFRQTAEGKLRTAWASISAAMIEFGGALAPVVKGVADLVAAASPLLKILLPLAATFAVLKLAGAAVAPVMTALSGVLARVGAAWAAFRLQMNLANVGLQSTGAAVAHSARGLLNAIGPTVAWTGALLLAGVAVQKLSDYLSQDDEQAKAWTADVLAGAYSLDLLKQKVDEVTGGYETATAAAAKFGGRRPTAMGGPSTADLQVLSAYNITAEETAAAIAKQNREILSGTPLYRTWGGVLDDTSNANARLHQSVAQLILRLHVQGDALTAAQQATLREKLATGDLEGAIRMLSRILGLGKGATRDLAAGTDELAGAHRAAGEAAKAQREAEQQLAGGLLGLLADLKGVRDAQASLDQLRKDGKAGTQEYRDAQVDLLGAQLNVNDGLRDYMKTLKESDNTQAQAIAKVVALGRQVGLTKEQVLKVLGPLDQYKRKWEAINRAPNITKTITTRFVTEGGGQNIVPAWKLGHLGGQVERLHGGGFGRLRSDERPAILQLGEFVMRKAAVERIGAPALEAMNEGRGGTALGTGDGRAVAAGRPQEIKLTLRPDRRRLSRDVGYDWVTRGT